MNFHLPDWTDADCAAFDLGIALGIIPEPGDSGWGDHKWVVWSDNPTGNALYGILNRLVEVGVLERRDDPDHQYRSNPQWTITDDRSDIVDPSDATWWIAKDE